MLRSGGMRWAARGLGNDADILAPPHQCQEAVGLAVKLKTLSLIGLRGTPGSHAGDVRGR